MPFVKSDISDDYR